MAEEKEQTLENKLDGAFKFTGLGIEDFLFLAKQAENAERFDDMIIFMKQLVGSRLENLKAADLAKVAAGDKKVNGHDCTGGPLSQEERNLFSVAYKNVVGNRRSAWRCLSDEGTWVDFSDAGKELCQKFKNTVANEIKETCLEIQTTLQKLADETQKLDDAKILESKDSWIFYKKMQGDYYRYLREAFKDEDEFKDKCKENYQAAMKAAEEKLEPTDPTRLGLALNYSVCHFEILDDPPAACKLAKSAFDEAIEKLDSLNDASYKDSTLIMQLLRDNLTIWSTPENQE